MEQFIQSEVARLTRNFKTGKTLTAEWRKKQLNQLLLMMKTNRMEIAEAIRKDLGSPVELVNVSEIGPAIQEVNLSLSKLDEWMAPEKKSIPLTAQPGSGFVYKQPFGVVCIIGPWNYPFRLIILPLIGAIAAGNSVVLKPSEVSANTSNVIKKLVTKYLDPDFFSVMEGDAQVSSLILSQKFDYIFYTGNTEVGRLVMKAASENLTPVTLELGGKSPVYVDKSCKLDVTVKRLVSGKLMNAGQTCVAPDYLLVHKDVKDKLVKEMVSVVREWYSDTPEKVEFYSRIINERHARRIQGYIEEVKDKVVVGGQVIPESRFVAPTVVDEPPFDSQIMKEEIFGPVLPIKAVSSAEEAIEIISSKPKPLALYIFSEDNNVNEKVINSTSSGSVCVNGVVIQIACPDIAFGGVGPSGMGSYNGKFTFDTFSHKRGVLKRSTWIDPSLGHPPFTKEKLAKINKVADGIQLPVGALVGVAAVAVATGSFIISRL